MRAAGLVLVGLVAISAPASAQSVEQGRRLYLNADFQGAADAFSALLARPATSAAEAAEAHRYLAFLRVLLGDPTAGQAEADAAIALDPTLVAPEGAPPEVTSLFDQARARTHGRRTALRITSEGARTQGEMLTIRATLAPAPVRLATALELRCVSGVEQATERDAPPSVSVQLRFAGDTVSCHATAGAAAGQSLVTERVELSPSAVPGTAELAGASAGTRDGDGDSSGGAPWLWIGLTAGVVVVVAATVVALVVIGGSNGDMADLGAPTVVGW